MPASFLWYDLETFGLDPRGDRIVQFAAARSDEALEPTGERLILYCRPSPDYLPNPLSCLVHGITPQHALEHGIREYDFAARILEAMSVPGTTVAGFNSLKFDDEFVRFLLYRNLRDAYEREYRRGNSRWDVIDLMRAAHDLRPEGLVWPVNDEGRPTFSLVSLAKANGVAHESAHDAMHDVLATIGLARLVLQRQPKLFEWYFTHRTRDSLRPLVDLVERTPLVHTSSEHMSSRGCTTLVAPVALDPENRNQLLAVDLRFDPAPLIGLPVEELRRRVFTKAEQLEVPRVPLVRIRLNRCPFLAPTKALSDDAAGRLGIDVEECRAHLDSIKRAPELLQKFTAVFDCPAPADEPDDPDLGLYTRGFFPDADREALEGLHAAIAASGPAAARTRAWSLRFEDDRPAQMLRRLYARNWPETLPPAEARRWRDFCAARLQMPILPGITDLGTYSKVVEQRLASPQTPARERGTLLALLEYRGALERDLFEYPAGGDGRAEGGGAGSGDAPEGSGGD